MSKKELILQEAAKLFAKKNFNEASTSEIAEAAGVAQGTIFYHFPTKQDILQEIYRSVTEEYLSMLAEAGARAKTGLDELRQLIRAHFAFIRSHADEYTILHRDLPSQLCVDPAIKQKIVENNRRKLNAIAEAIRRGQADGSVRPDADAAGSAQLIGAMFGGIGRTMYVNVIPFPQAEEVSLFFCINALEVRGNE